MKQAVYRDKIPVSPSPAQRSTGAVLSYAARKDGLQFTDQRPVQGKFNAGTIQLFTKSKGWKISENKKYKVYMGSTAGRRNLHVKEGASGPLPQKQFTKKTQSEKGYTKYEYGDEFRNDCLGFAEKLATGQYSNNKGLLRTKADKGYVFGSSIDRNIEVTFGDKGSGFSKGTYANPGVGEAYTILRNARMEDRCPYHAATVVAKDGIDRITCEADASDTTRTAGLFNMYQVDAEGGKASGKTFHDVYKKYYSTDDQEAMTGVLEQRPEKTTNKKRRKK